ncbi:MAG: substrate-binding domain-containing protein [Cyanobacteria bacterium P01_A01_bin.84]
MSRKNEIPVLILSLLISLGLIAVGYWWFTKNSELNLKKSTYSSQTKNQSIAALKDIPKGVFSYGGSTSWAPIRALIHKRIEEIYPQFKLRYVEPSSGSVGSTAGIKMLINGQLAFAQSSRPLLDEEINRVQQRGTKLKSVAVAIDGLAVVVNPQVNVPGITIDQLKSIYIGKFSNWQELGGSNIPIKAYSRKVTDGGTVELFVQDILGNEKFGSKIDFVSNTTQALRKVAANPGGIYYASAPEAVPQCSVKPLPLGRTQGRYITPYQKPLVLPNECPSKRNKLNIEAFQSGTYPITRKLFVVVKQNEQIEEQAGNAYAKILLTEQGQELINQAGFVKIR